MPETLDSHESSTDEHTPRSLRVSEWPVVRKVALVLAIPLLLAVVLGGLRVQDELAIAATAEASASKVTVLGPAVTYLAAAEDAATVFRSTDGEQEREAALKSVNDAAAALETAWSTADLTVAQRQQVRDLLDGTLGLRDGSAYTIVSTATNQLQSLEADVTLGVAGMTEAGAGTESLLTLVGALNEGRLAVTLQQLLVNPRPDVIPKNELYGHLGVESAAIGSLEQLLPGNSDVTLLRQYNDTNTGLLGIGTPELKGQAPLRLYDDLNGTVLGQLESSLAQQASDANRTALLTAAATALALLLAIGLALAVSRLLVRPVRAVRDGALAVAHQELPETVRRIRAGQDPGVVTTIPVTTHEEMGQLARAVDDLHETAVRLAQDEAELRSRVADMFVTLSRRNTSLVNQQLRLIERLETDEEDPQRLESLFQLDHLASRMRRTAESLVVLADAPTQASEQDSLSIDEALQGALAGVKDYQRVRVFGAPPLKVTGTAAADLVHLFTELVDNALAYSPPHATVQVTTTTPAGLVLVEVSDRGLGIDQATLADLNQTLRTGADVTADTARRMGLFVVARLARRHGLTVTLERNAEGGTTAKVFIPRPLLTSGASGPAAPVSELPVAAPVATDAELEAAVEVEAHDEVEVEAESEVEVESEVEAQDEVEADVEPEVEAEVEADPEAEPEADPEAEDEVDSEVEAEADVEAEPEDRDEDQDQDQDQVEVEDEADPELELEDPLEDQTEAEREAGLEPVSEETDQAEQSDEPEPEPEPVVHGAAARLAAIRSMRPVAPAAVRPNLADAMFKRPGLPEGSPLAREQAPTTPYPTRSPAPAPDPAPAETGAAGMDALAAVINANIRLPQRRPGTAPQPEPLTPVLPRNQEPAPEATAEEPSPAVEAQIVEDQIVEDQPVADQVTDEQVIEQEQPEDSPLLEPDAQAEVPETLDTEVLATVTALRGSDALDDPLSSSASYALDEHSDDDETPMFRMLRSGWFTNDADDQGWGPGEADEGWQAADRISDAAPSRLTRSGLPVRDPGNRLVPGGMAQPAPTLHRDPEAIRARLSAHAAGVARGRTMATAAAHDQSTDPAEDVTPR